MSKELLITRPDYDHTTRYISAWAKKIMDFAGSRGWSILDLDGKRANKKEFESMLTKRNPSGIMLNGHGNESFVSGQDGEVLIRIGINDDSLTGKIVYALSCKSAKLLGPACIKLGTQTYIGYEEDFIFMYSNEKLSRPLEDKTAELFFDPSNQVFISLIKGQDAETAHKNSKRAFIRNVQKLLTSQTSSEETAALRYLLWDLRHQVCLGDGSAHF